jgi:hypothetical protein
MNDDEQAIRPLSVHDCPWLAYKHDGKRQRIRKKGPVPMHFGLALIGKRYWLAMLLATLHAMLTMIVIMIEMAEAWNDMNPTILFGMLFYYANYPIISIVQHFSTPQYPGAGGVLLVGLIGTVMWYIVRMLL